MKAVWLALALTASAVAAPTDGITIHATSVNVVEAGAPVTITLQRWSTDEERAPLLNALNPAPGPAAATAPPADGGGARGARGGARGRGARGRGPTARLTPIEAFTAALGRAPTIGYLWTKGITGYAIKYAWHAALPDGTDRIVLGSDRRLGAYTDAWKATAPMPDTDYLFTLIELRVSPRGAVEGKTSLMSKIVVDTDAHTVALENYSAAPAVLGRVTH
jgi:hypothetical protein